MPLVKQKGGISARRNLNILCDVFLLSTFLLGILLTVPVCCAKIETQIKLLNDDFTVPTQTGGDDGSFSLSSATDTQQPSVPHYNLYKNDLQRISYETIHRILRDENEPMIYRTNDLRYFQKRSNPNIRRHEISKRSIKETTPSGIVLNLTNSRLEDFSQEVLNLTHSLKELTSIILRNNSLKEFPMSTLPNLDVLDLSSNNLTHFDVSLENHPHLRILNLNQNHIINFTTTTSHNNTLHVPLLHELHLKDNSMRLLSQLNLSLLNELEILDLSCNQLENLETAFFPTRMKNLKYLNLARNRLQCIYRETFYNLLSMNTLILSYNDITGIDYETFLALPNLQYLDLSHNQLRGDSIRALQGIPDLVGLSIAYNEQLGDSMQEFVASWSLKELDASGTGLCKIPAALAQSVRTLKLADNWLTIINCGDLDSYPLLQYLDLSNSHIDEIEEDALGRLEILETLFLDHNNLKRIPISLPTSLEHLFLHDNQIMDIQPQSFQGLNNLRTLDLSSNKLLYLPDLPLPKLLTLNLQSSGINNLHQAIVKTSPHLRDLYLEDNPIKCADLLGIAEWASPCRNDRRIVERINIKSHYVRMHNYFERFQCGGDAEICAKCLGDVNSNGTIRGSPTKPNCVEVNGVGTIVTKTTPSVVMLIQNRKSNEETKYMKPPTAPTAEITLTRKMFAGMKSTTTSKSPTTDANPDELRRTNVDPETLPTTTAAQPEISITTTTTAIAAPLSQIETNSTDKISPLPQQQQQQQQKQLPGSTTPMPSTSILPPAKLKSDSNYVETSAGTTKPTSLLAPVNTTPSHGMPFSSSRPTLFPSPLHHQSSSTSPVSLLSQEITGKSQKGLEAQSDKATKIGHGPNGEISVVSTAAKSNLPTMTVNLKQQQQQEQQHEQDDYDEPHSNGAEDVQAITMTISQKSGGKGSNVVATERQLQRQQKHNKIQEILHTKDRHLIGTPLLMHKGHVMLIPPGWPIPTAASIKGTIATQTTTTTTTTTTSTSNENLLLLAQRQDGKRDHSSRGSNTSTTIATSKEYKLEMLVDTYPRQYHSHQNQHQQQQQQPGSDQNTIIKGAKKKMTNGPLSQENHYQDIQQIQQHNKFFPKKILPPQQQKPPKGIVSDKKSSVTTTTQQEFKETNTTAHTMPKDNDQKDDSRQISKEFASSHPDQDKQFASNLGATTKSGIAQQSHSLLSSHSSHSSHSLNTPLDGAEIQRHGKDLEIFKEIDRDEGQQLVTTTESGYITGMSLPTGAHHSRVNMALMKNDNGLQNVHALVIPSNSLDSSPMHSATEGQTIYHYDDRNPTSTSTIGPSESKPAEAASSIQEHHTIKSERWLDIRKATRHPGLVVVIGVTFFMVFAVGLVQVYRYRQKPLNYIGHRNYRPHQMHHHHQYQRQDHNFQDLQRHSHQYHHLQQHHQHHLNQETPASSFFSNSISTSSSSCIPDNGRCPNGNNHNQCSSCNVGDRMQPTSSSTYNSPHHLLRIHGKPPPLLSSATSQSPSSPPRVTTGSNYEIQSEKCSSACATNRSSSSITTNITSTNNSTNNSTNTSTSNSNGASTSNYRLFQLNGRRIKRNHQMSLSSAQPPPDDNVENDFYSEMNHGGPQSVLASDFFPMELLSAPSRIQSSSPSMVAPLPTTNITTSSSNTMPPSTSLSPPTTTHPSLVSLVVGEQQKQQSRRIIDEYQDTDTTGKERSKFEIW